MGEGRYRRPRNASLHHADGLETSCKGDPELVDSGLGKIRRRASGVLNTLSEGSDSRYALKDHDWIPSPQ
jgi:hypothetical protein